MAATSSDVETVERIIPAPASAIFALLADPARHHEIDGSGTVREAKNGSQQLRLGSKFGMSMKLGIPYSMVSEVVEFEQDRRIAWQTRPPIPLLGKLVGGRIWRYELDPVEGGTRVRESWDITHEQFKALVRPARGKTNKAMAATLARIEQLLTA
ncbi:MAG: SRPBCC family protein [Acidimicrobiia bacterium]